MKRIKKVVKMMVIVLSTLLLITAVASVAFLNLSPEFGGKATKELKADYLKSGLYEKGKFVNQIPTSMDLNFKEMVKVMVDFIKGDPNRAPVDELPVLKVDSLDIVHTGGELTQLTWFGHSAFLLEIEGKKILIDPMLGITPSPLPVFGVKRFTKELPVEIERLPQIDAVIISHDHYDHLDHGSIIKLMDKVGAFYMPLGVGNHLRSWGVPMEKVNELTWWEETAFGDLTFKCAPARHFSGRGLTDRNSTLWSSWVIQSDRHNIYFSGDSGYGPHFKEIGEKYGPFDIAMMECGQYNERWEAIHMLPEQTAQAFLDVKGKILMPIHWGAFALSLHSWKDPIERVSAKSEDLDITITTPRIGETITLGGENIPDTRWWEGVL